MVPSGVAKDGLIAYTATAIPVPCSEALAMPHDQGPLATRAGRAGVTAGDTPLATRMEDQPEGLQATRILRSTVPCEAREACAKVNDLGSLAADPLMVAVQVLHPALPDASAARLHGLAAPVLPPASEMGP